MSRKQGFQLGKRFNKGLWKLWDSLTPSERIAYEEKYEEKDNHRCSMLMAIVRPVTITSGIGS